MINDSRECKSSEEMRASFEDFNRNLDEAIRKKVHILSMDIKSLYPSLKKAVCKDAIKWLINKCGVSLTSIDWVQVSRYVAVMCTPEEIAEAGLTEVVPGRAKMTRRKLTLHSLQVKTADTDWLPSQHPDDNQKRKLFGLVMAAGVDIIMSNHTFMVGDEVFLQSEGGPIGLEFAGAIARAVMMQWNFLYLEKLTLKGYNMVLYERFVDDENQAVEVPDGKSIKVVAEELKEIADSILPGITVEVDLPENYPDKKLPILDMKCYMKDGYIVYEHYEKPMALKLVISSRSAHSTQTKKSVHISECVRRMMNTSPRLPWSEFVVPHLTEYCRRLMAAGYSQSYRKEIVRNAITIFDSKLKNDADGVAPLNRPRGYRKLERRTEKKIKKQSWGTRGGYVAPIIVPATPGSELAEKMRAVCEAEAIPGLRFKVVERGGVTIKRQLQKSNPTASNTCGRSNCGPWEQPGGMNGTKLCHKPNVVYEYTCQFPGCDAVYVGETSKNLFTRDSQHQYNYLGGPNSNTKLQEKSFIFQHQTSKHQGQEANFKRKVLRSYKDCLSRQASEGIFISHINGEILNNKSEFHQPAIVTIRREINRGL